MVQYFDDVDSAGKFQPVGTLLSFAFNQNALAHTGVWGALLELEIFQR